LIEENKKLNEKINVMGKQYSDLVESAFKEKKDVDQDK